MLITINNFTWNFLGTYNEGELDILGFWEGFKGLVHFSKNIC